MTTAARLAAHRLTVEVRPCGQGEGFDVDASCNCPARWDWIGWQEAPAGALDVAGRRWEQHLRAVYAL